MTERKTVVMGQEVFYEFDSEKDLDEQSIDLELYAYDGWGIDNHWTETRTAKKVGEETYRVSWIVKLDESGDEKTKLKPPVEIQCYVKQLAGQSDPLILDMRQIVVTKRPELLRIMVHEFHKAEGDDWVFDPKELEEYLDRLTPQQRTVLCAYPIPEGKTSRLVTFITIIPQERRKWMRADYTGAKPGPAKANASFAMFRCVRDGDVELICYTEHCLINAVYHTTPKIFSDLNKAGKLRTDNPSPSRYLLVTGRPGPSNDDVPYIRIYTPEGKNFMPSNSLHGVVNTKGCYTLFRNFHWPEKGSWGKHPERDVADEFLEQFLLYRQRPEDVGDEKLKESLKEYDDYEPSKFWFERNYAYFWLLHEIVGLRYWGKGDDWPAVNDYKTHGRSFEPKVPTGYTYDPPRYPGEQTGLISYPTPAGQTYPDSLWGPNIFGDEVGSWAGKEKTVEELDEQGKKKKLLENPECAWGDLFFYREGQAELPKLKYGE